MPSLGRPKTTAPGPVSDSNARPLLLPATLPGLTKEACQFNDNLAGFQAAGVPVIGISPDDATSHQRFRNKYGLRFPLLTDADHAVMDAWGAWGEKTSYGRKSVGVLRSTFLLDDQGRVERAWHNVKADGHAASVLSQLRN